MKRTSLAAAILLATTVSIARGEQPAQAPVLLEVKRFEIVGDNPLSESESEAALRPHLGPHTSVDTLEAAAAALEKAIRDQGYAFYRVVVPAQQPVEGVVKLQLIRFPIGNIEVVGNEHFSRENVLASVPELVPGQSPDVREVSRQLGLANEHPSKRTTVVMKEGSQKDTVDAEVRVRDVAPQQIFLGVTGHSRDEYNEINDNTGYTRWTLGYQRSDLFDLDHALTATYTTSPDHLSDVEQYGLFYWLPLYGFNTSLSAYYARSTVDSGTIGSGSSSFDVSGSGEFAGVRATHALPRFRETSQSLSVAIDDKYFESTTRVLGLKQTPAVRSRPMSLRYAARNTQPWGGIGGYLEYDFNLSGGSDNDDAAYNANRFGASPDWNATRYGLDGAYALPNGWGLSARVRGQYAGEPLISGELFGLGGSGSIRGLRDREFAGDRGYTITVEALGPALIDTLQPLLFIDRGSATLTDTPALGPSQEHAGSIGLGIRWNWQRKLDIAADVAYVTQGVGDVGTTPGTPDGFVKLHFSAFYRF
jgi:hemolysin activation/secretion protein